MFILDLVNNCNNPALANILVIIKRFINILQILVPIIAMIFLAVKLIKMTSDPENKKNFPRIKNWLIAVIMVFALPVIVDTVMNLLGENYSISSCWDYAEKIQTTGQNSNYNDSNDGNKKDNGILIDPDEYDDGVAPGSNNSNDSSNSTNSTSNGVGVIGTHKNSKNGITYNLYNQSSSEWNGHYYSSGQTIQQNGCMNTSVAVVSSAYDKNITPVTVFKKYRHSHPRTSISKLTNGSFKCSSGSTKKSNIVNVLNDGNVVVIMVYGRKKGGSSKFTSSQHYMALIDINDSKVFIGNAYSNSGHGKTGWFNVDEVLKSIQVADYCYPSDSLKGR